MFLPNRAIWWITKLVDGQGRWRLDSPIVWTQKLVRRLEASEDKIARVVNHQLDRVIKGFVTEFTVDTSISYNEAEWLFFKGLRGKHLRSLNTWIKILLYEKQVMQLPWCLELRKVESYLGIEGEQVLNIAHWLGLLWVITKKQHRLRCEALSS